MSLLLNWRLWAALLLAGVLAFSHLTVYRKGQHEVRAEWSAAVAAADAEARRLEQARQRRANEAAQMAAQREAGIRAAAARARGESDGLRDDLSAAVEYAAQSRAAAQRIAGVASELLGRCTSEYLRVAEEADRADNEARQLRLAWPR